MDYFGVFLGIVFFIINIILIIKTIKSKKELKGYEYNIVDLNLKNGREKNNYKISYYSIIVMIVSIQIMVICSLIVGDIKFIMFVGSFYAMILALNNQYFYVSKNRIGTLYKINNTENINYIEAEFNNDYCKMKLCYKDKSEKKLSLRCRNTNGLIKKLRDHNYEVHYIQN